MKKSKKILIIIGLSILVIVIAILVYCAIKGIGPFDNSPTISLKGDSQISLYLGDEYKEPGFTALSYDGKDLNQYVEVDKSDIRSHGTHEITYSITDNDKTAKVTRTVEVKYKTPDKNDPHYGHGIPVCMYHNVFEPSNPPPKGTKFLRNWISTTDLSAQMEYLVKNNYYFPTWQEVRDYVDGKIELPVKSVVLTFDDCREPFLNCAVPVLEKYDVKATSFNIGSYNGEKVMKEYKDKCKHINFQSHSYDMHRLKDEVNNRVGIFAFLSYDEGYADVKKSIDILKTHEAFAYPYGDYSKTSKKVISDLGFLCAFTTKSGLCHPGDDPLLLPRVRINNGMGAEDFAKAIKTDK